MKQVWIPAKGASRKAALASALGEFFERLATNYFWADYYLGHDIANSEFVHYPEEQWFAITENMYYRLKNIILHIVV